jgi:hypothetical protein
MYLNGTNYYIDQCDTFLVLCDDFRQILVQRNVLNQNFKK